MARHGISRDVEMVATAALKGAMSSSSWKKSEAGGAVHVVLRMKRCHACAWWVSTAMR